MKKQNGETITLPVLTGTIPAIYLCKGGQGQACTWIWIGFDGDIKDLNDRLKSPGATIKLPPTNFSWAYEMHIQDPDGHILRFETDTNENEVYADG